MEITMISPTARDARGNPECMIFECPQFAGAREVLRRKRGHQTSENIVRETLKGQESRAVAVECITYAMKELGA